ncbi:type IV pilus secretin PilQ [Silanimonas sp.]|uniref:type IV pilus secretin PilQ n=1 Tax=Silanimonas sp. TaxID=1929290 RepID=UPI0022C83FC7|nr:type IV pilus secretin PilQ [Silanimonas sp.]MCZ8064097.1 type IV pilus secretin PilQ [Silanimonas sp.]
MSTKKIAARAALAACLLWTAAFPALAANTLKDVRYAAGSGGKVDITFEFEQPVGAVNAFTTDVPPRIAIDFPETGNGFDARRLAVGSGAASAVSVVEAGGRTRAVVDLFRNAGYTTRSNGNLLVLSLEPGAAASSATAVAASPNPAKRLDSGIRVSAVDFRRGEDGSGRVILRFNQEGAQASLRRDGDRLYVDVENAQLPVDQARRLDVTDFATPVTRLDPTSKDGGTQLVIATEGLYETSAYQTGNEYVLEVTPKGAATAAVGQVGAASQPQRYTGKPVTFNFQDVPVRTILQLVAEESGLNIVAADTVQGNLTLRLINVPWDQALDVVLRAKSLAKRRDGNVVWVAPQDEIAAFEKAREQARIDLEGKAELVNEIIAINYANAEEIATLLTDGSKSGGGGGSAGGGDEGGFLSGRGSVSFDTRSNTLLIADTARKVEAIKSLVAVLDRPVDQVLIEARIVIAQESFAREVGARFGLSGQESDVVVSGSTESNRNYLNGVANANAALARYQFELDLYNQAIANGETATRPSLPNTPLPTFTNILSTRFANNTASALAFTILGNELDLDIELQALQEEGRGEVVANPRVITANQREAIIKQGDEIGYVTITGSAGAQTATVQFKEALLELKVTPTITQDNRVFLALGVKKDEVAGFISVPGGGSVPQITKREVTTAVLINNGQTVVVGGIYEFEKREDLSKVPFLGDIPGLGNLFRNKARESEKAELLIFVTPRILQVAGASR